MPRYFFNLRSPDGYHLDIDGLVLDTLNEAVEQAHVAAELALEMADGPTEGVFEIEDGARVLQARVPFRAVSRDESAAFDAASPASN
jgi:hypothetical protein